MRLQQKAIFTHQLPLGCFDFILAETKINQIKPHVPFLLKNVIFFNLVCIVSLSSGTEWFNRNFPGTASLLVKKKVLVCLS